MQKLYGYETVDLDGDLEILAPCGCHACTERVQQGHPYCSVAPDALVKAEERREVWRSLDNSTWRWYANVRKWRPNNGDDVIAFR